MTKTTLVVGLDGSETGARALAFAKEQARQIGDATIALIYVVEWSPFSFQTPEENAERHKRREEELKLAHERVLDPAVSAVKGEGFDVTGTVRHGDVAEILDEIAQKAAPAQIIIGRVGHRGLRERLFGSVGTHLVASASVPVTIVP